MKTNQLFIKHFQFFARNFPNRGSPESVTAIRKLKCTNPLKKSTRCQRSSQRLRHAKHSKCHRFLQQPFSNAVSESESSVAKRLRTQPASRREGTQLSRKSKRNATLLFLKLNSPFSNSVPHFFSLPHRMLVLCFLALFAVLNSKHTKSNPILYFCTVFRP